MARAWREWSGGRWRVLAAAVTMAAGGLVLVAQPALAATVCVGSGHGCYPTIQAAVNASSSLPSGFACPGGFPQGQCPFAPALGGGIDSWGALTLIRTAVTSNTVGGEPGITSDADGAGIFSREGSLTLDGSVVSGNHATAVAPAGRYAEGAGIFAGVPDFGSNGGHDVLVLRNSVVSGNVATLSSNLPSLTGGKLLDQKANGGGVLVPPVLKFATPVTIENTQLTNNSVLATDLNGEPVAINAAINGHRAVRRGPGRRHLERGGLHTAAGPAHPAAHHRDPQLAEREPRRHGPGRGPILGAARHRYRAGLGHRGERPGPVRRLLTNPGSRGGDRGG